VSSRRPVRPTRPRALLTLFALAAGPAAVLVSDRLVDLPAELAVHWDARAPDGYLPASSLSLGALAVGVVAVLVAAAVLAVPGPPFLARRFVVGACSAASGAAAGVWGLLVVTTATAPVPAAPPPPDVEVVVLVAGVVGSSALAGAAYGQPPADPAPPPPAADLPRAELGPADPPRWSRTSYSGFFLTCVGLLLVVGALLYRSVALAAVLAWVMAVLTVVLVRLRCSIDERGLSLQAWGRGPSGTVPWSRVVEARAVLIRPLQWGGWGFRVIPARAGVVTRKGPGLVLTLTDGRRLGITVDEPLLPAGLVNTHLDRLRAGTPTRGG